MAVYTWGLTYTDVVRGIAHQDGGIAANAEPATTEITALLNERSAEVNDAWYGAKGEYPTATLATTDETTHTAIAGKIRRRVIADWLGANQREETEATARHIEEFDTLIADFREAASRVTGSSGATGTTIQSSFRQPTVADGLTYKGRRSRRWRDPNTFT